MSEVGARIKALRTSKGFTMEELVRRTGLSRTSLYRYEQGETKAIPAKVMLVLADTLGTTVDYLLGETDNADEQLYTVKEWSLMELVDNQAILTTMLVRWGYTVSVDSGQFVIQKDGATWKLNEEEQNDLMQNLHKYFEFLLNSYRK